MNKEKFSSLFVIILLSWLLFSCGGEKTETFRFERTVSEKREEFRNNLKKNIVENNLSRELTDSTEEAYKSAFWGMELANYRPDTAAYVLRSIFGDYKNRSAAFRRAFLEVIYTLYPDRYTEEVKQIAEAEQNPKLYAMAVKYLVRSDKENRREYMEHMKQKFSSWKDNPILYMLHYELSVSGEKRPPVTDLLNHSFGGKPVLFSIQRKNRDYPGITVIKKADGEFLTTGEDTLFYIPHLARAVTDLPGYITNGNTPQGILSIQGTDISENVFIGPTPNIQFVMPYEASPGKFFHDTTGDNTWSYELYSSLLPDSWKNYTPVYEAFYAGKAGRTEIISHGTTINPDYYREASFYPNTPSLGCLTASELWSAETGERIKSDQVKLIDAYNSLEKKEGYFIIIELNDEEKPVTINEVKGIIGISAQD